MFLMGNTIGNLALLTKECLKVNYAMEKEYGQKRAKI